MLDIDSIMDMLDWNNDEDTQAKGRELAREIKCINVFLQPAHPEYNKNVWDNCALILSDRTDIELSPYLMRMFEWLEDMNWPGAFTIRDRLLQFKDSDWLMLFLNSSIDRAKALGRKCWLSDLMEFKNEYMRL